ncbi:MAG TPA: glycosyltransferase [Ktedonobacteraceae bacterium]|nr:glycosyltransferase [Ktedonobacteraceae bacterium]
MIETVDFHNREMTDGHSPVQSSHNEHDARNQEAPSAFNGLRLLRQVLRFALVGGLNTIVDLLILNGLLLLFPTTSTFKLLAYNSLAYSLGAINSFLLNKYWTFGQRQPTTGKEVQRFVLTTLAAIGWSSIILWLASSVLHPLVVNPTVWANASKVFAIAGTALISYLGMRLWVFVNNTHQHPGSRRCDGLSSPVMSDFRRRRARTSRRPYDFPLEGGGTSIAGEERLASRHSLSVVLPAYNEEQVIARTVSDVLDVLSAWQMDVELLVVNDGSTDRTGAIVGELAIIHPQVHLITHTTNQGYGAALVSGFAAASKELTFFMDSDGQFDIRDLRQFFPLIDEYDAVLGYRIDRQDSWMRKFNAWGWKCLVGRVFGVHVRDIDCAFKLLHTDFLRQHPLETRGAMINAELLYRLTRAGCSYREVGVHHHPRLGGRATGARPAVILRALRELFASARATRREEHQQRLIPDRERQLSGKIHV